MSPKGLLAILLVGLCASQIAATRTNAARQSRQVQALIDAAESKLKGVLANTHDAAESGVETVMGYITKLEDMALTAGNEKLEAMKIPIDLKALSALIKSNVNECVSNENVKDSAQALIKGMTSCVTTDVKKLEDLIENAQKLWATAKNMPASMKKVAHQCSEHGQDEGPAPAGDVLEALHDKSNHDLAPVTNELIKDASKSMSKRALWSFGRIARCFKSVYSLTKTDMVHLPGQILTTATQAFQMFKSATGNNDIPKCIRDKTTENVAVIKGVVGNIGSCLATKDLKEIVKQNPGLKLEGVQTIVDAAVALKNGDHMSALGNAAKLMG